MQADQPVWPAEETPSQAGAGLLQLRVHRESVMLRLPMSTMPIEASKPVVLDFHEPHDHLSKTNMLRTKDMTAGR